ncbi:DNA-3-methyladenine glycosylase I [Legionella israelensis]|uniref:DNA-3-methyladenine glycosylase I n=1 Tax=Legionella israelensis TaxID=454 RepID=UPI001180E3EA|nr:DNA-3-methyladenine glycosylase I [Legionella israelensis]QDP73328.1 DNA-3-methyladenine glycosylase I [Legionella israelensis]
MEKERCQWVGTDLLSIQYHDNEWGKPVYEDKLLFEFLILEGMQAGLSWLTILKKRQNYREAFDHFDAKRIVNYDSHKFKELMANEGIIRNKLKIQSIIINASAFLKLKQEAGNFSTYIWSFVDNKPIINHWKNFREIPPQSVISDAMAKDLKQRGFKFVGSTICYAFMQAIGMVNDHTVDCFCHPESGF